MKHYKISKYVYIKEKQQIVYLFNTFTVEMVKMNRMVYGRLVEQIENDTIDLDSVEVAYLIKKRFLISDGIEEERMVDKKYFETCHSNKILAITILPTEACNFRCEYCYEEHKQNKMSDEIQNEIVEFVRRNLKYYAGISVSWFGGEPLLYPDIIERISMELKELCRKAKKPYNAIMTTNGYLLTLDMFKRMKKCNITNYQITIDGAKEVHDKQRFLVGGKPTYDTIINNLIEIKENEKSPLYTFDLRTNLTRTSLPTFKTFSDYISKTFLVDKRFRQRIKYAWNGTGEEEYNRKLIANGEELSLKNIDEMVTLVNNYMKSTEDETQLRRTFERQIISHYPCYAAKSNTFIFGPDGRVAKCTVHFDDSEDGIVGKLGENGIICFNDSVNTKWITQSSDIEKRKECYDCVVYPICQGVNCPYKLTVNKRTEEQCNSIRSSIISVFEAFSMNDKLCCVIKDV